MISGDTTSNQLKILAIRPSVGWWRELLVYGITASRSFTSPQSVSQSVRQDPFLTRPSRRPTALGVNTVVACSTLLIHIHEMMLGGELLQFDLW